MSLQLGSLREELAELDISIKQQPLSLEELQLRRAVVEAELDLYTYPVLTLPPEITSEIFVQSLPSHGPVTPHPSESPLIFLGICRTWRSLALSTPALWTSLDLDVDNDHLAFRASGKLEPFVETWFHRARTLPRSFGFFGAVDNAYDHPLNRILEKQAPYLREISVCLDSDSVLNLRDGPPFPVLHHLELGALNCDLEDTETPSDAFRLAPRLQSLSLLSVPPSAFAVPWEQLTTLYVQSLDVEECLSVLRLAPSLREFRYYGGAEAQTTPGPPFPHPGLISLDISRPSSGGIIPFLALPNLQRLELRGLSVLSDAAVPLPFISSSSLHTFILSDESPMVTLPWLRVMEHLTSLELGNPLWVYKEDLFHALDRAHEPRFLPKLENFTLSNCEMLEVSQRLLDALLSRCGPTAEGLTRLKSFYVSDTAGRRSEPLLFH